MIKICPERVISYNHAKGQSEEFILTSHCTNKGKSSLWRVTLPSCPVSDLNPTEDLAEDMWLGVSVASQGRPGGRVLVSLCSHWLIEHLMFVRLHLAAAPVC